MQKNQKGERIFMQSKNIKKILAIITAAGAILTTPGLVSATKTCPEKPKEETKTKEENCCENSNFFNERGYAGNGQRFGKPRRR